MCSVFCYNNITAQINYEIKVEKSQFKLINHQTFLTTNGFTNCMTKSARKIIWSKRDSMFCSSQQTTAV